MAPVPELARTQVYLFGAQPIRVMAEADPWFVLSDVARVLGIRNARNVAARLDEAQRGVRLVDTPGGPQQVTVISESGFYRVVLRSDSPEAEPFQAWVTEQVLPTLRRTGRFGPDPEQPPALALPDFRDPAAAARAWADEYDGRQQALAQVATLAPKAEVYDALLSAEGLKLVDEVAKELGWGPQKFRDRLYHDEVLMHRARHGEHRHNLPYQTHLDAGRFVVRPRTWMDAHGVEHSTRTTYFTPRGLLWAAGRYPQPEPSRRPLPPPESP